MPIPGCRVTSYSTCIEAAVLGVPQRGIVHSVFDAAANIVFPQNFILSLNSASSSRMPNGLQLSAPSATFPFSNLRPGMPVLLGAQRLHIEALPCSLDLSLCLSWNPHIKHPPNLNQNTLTRNAQWLIQYTSNWPPNLHNFSTILSFAHHLCGRGPGLTPTGDDILAGWIAAGWLLHGPTPNFLKTCQQIVNIAKQQTHLLSQCWLQHAAQGNVAEPIGTLLTAMTQNDDEQLEHAAKAVLSMGATSGHDIIQGILLHFTSTESM